MKNKKIIIILFIYLFSFINTLTNNSIAKEIKFETSKINITDNGNKIFSINGKALLEDNNFEIKAKYFEYTKNLGILKSYGDGVALIKNKGLKIKFDEAEYNQFNETLIAKGNVEIFESRNNLKLYSEEIIYLKKKNLIKSNKKSKLIDQFNNIYLFDNYTFKITENLIHANNINFKDSKKNTIILNKAFINTKSVEILGKDIELKLNNDFNKENNPRAKGNSISYNDKTTEITKGIFTNCKENGECPPWQISAKKIKHNKSSQLIEYDDAILKVYNLPVMYFPKFFHPDPTVKRKSGFLAPSILNSNKGENFISTPYFFAISQNKDATFSPRFYKEEKLLFQTEYRQKNFNSFHISDFSIFKDKDSKSKSHFFYNFNKSLNIFNSNDANLKLNLEKTSNDTYIKKNKIESNFNSDDDNLENHISFNINSNNLNLDIETFVYEDLNKSKNDRYEYIFPKISLFKKIEETEYDGNIFIESKSMMTNYNTNIIEKTNINDLILNSSPKITNNGLYHNYELLFKNMNSNSENSENYKNKNSSYFSGIFQYNAEFPLIKKDEKNQKILKPKMTLKIAPEHTKNKRDKRNRIDINNIYLLNRFSESDHVEGGLSLTYGSDYIINDLGNEKEKLSLKFANNLRLKENEDLKGTNQIGDKTSNFFGELKYNFNDYFTLKYDAAIKSNLTENVYENFITEFKINNFVTSFDYLNDNDSSNKNSYLSNETTYYINKSNNIAFSTRRNKTLDLTEYYNLMYQYKNDCLAASIEYNKDYYNDRDLKPTENIYFKLTILPFGEINSPSLK